MQEKDQNPNLSHLQLQLWLVYLMPTFAAPVEGCLPAKHAMQYSQSLTDTSNIKQTIIHFPEMMSTYNYKRQFEEIKLKQSN